METRTPRFVRSVVAAPGRTGEVLALPAAPPVTSEPGDAPDGGDAPDVPDASEAPDAPDAPEVPGVPDVMNTSRGASVLRSPVPGFFLHRGRCDRLWPVEPRRSL
ncbi:hypothetical protein GCM10010344_16460 [Streptomyces bluensis]|nr:hypothetical protein GCM10010344_16460 [Streptomyces bluensis]